MLEGHLGARHGGSRPRGRRRDRRDDEGRRRALALSIPRASTRSASPPAPLRPPSWALITQTSTRRSASTPARPTGTANRGAWPGTNPRPTPPVLARAAMGQMGPRARVMPVIVLHGDQDNRVPYRCGTQALAQWLGTDNLVLHQQGRAALVSAPSRASYAGDPGRAPLHRALLCRSVGLRDRPILDRPRDGPRLVGGLGRSRLGAIHRSARAERRRRIMGLLLPLAALWTPGAVRCGAALSRRTSRTGADERLDGLTDRGGIFDLGIVAQGMQFEHGR